VAGTKAGHRFEAKRKAYLSPRTVAFNVQGVRLAVHRVTAEIRILHSVHAADIGRLINPLQCRGQIEGSIGMGFGWALTEKMVYDGGTMVNPQLRNYRIPAFADVPRSEVFFADTYDSIGPLGAKAGRMRDQSCRSGHRERADQCDRRALPASAVHARPHLQQAG
jgi:CO/xanthine dehydrogenase Mo-binding subunit